MTKTVNSEQELREQLAAIEHERWADWQRWMHTKGRYAIFNGEPLFVFDEPYIHHLNKQIETPYAELTEREKDSDREQVDRYWPLVRAYANQTANQRAVSELLKLEDSLRDGADLGVVIYERVTELQATLKQKETE